MNLTDIRRLSTDDYHRMVETGILDPDESVELIEGQLFRMAAKGTAHSAAMTRLKRILEPKVGDRALIRYQDPIRLGNDSEPEPDVAVVRWDALDYEECHPAAEETFWLIEVCDRTLQRDRDFKVPLYGKSGVVETWLLDVRARQLWVYRNPSKVGYEEEFVFSEEEAIAPLAFPDCTVYARDFLRPLN